MSASRQQSGKIIQKSFNGIHDETSSNVQRLNFLFRLVKLLFERKPLLSRVWVGLQLPTDADMILRDSK